MLLTKEVWVGLKNQTVKWYENKDYEIPRYKNSRGKYVVKIGTKIKVKTKDLTDSSSVLVDVQCDGCGRELLNTPWYVYKKYVKEDGKYYCNQCANAGFKKWISFYEWCYINLPKEEADKILSRWDYELNVDKNGKVITPNDITFGSDGISKKGYWFKCLDHPEHKSELKNIGSFTNGCKGSVDCSQCNSISITHPQLVKYLVNKEDLYKYSHASNKKIPMQCPECGYEKEMNVNNLVNTGFSCSQCSDHIPYTEKFFFNFLQQLRLDFKFQLTKITYKWCEDYRYDFYINKINGIVETMGEQHYEEKTGTWGHLEKIQDNDFNKEWVARKNKIANYIIIDCRKSDMEWIKTNIMKSRLPTILNFKEKDIDWFKCHEFACNSLVKVICSLWDNGMKDTLKISGELKLSRATIIKYLKQGAKLGWCDYDPIKEKKKVHIQFKNLKRGKSIICLTTNEIFNSQKEAGEKYHISSNNICQCCSHKTKSAGKHPETGEKMVWMFYEEYLNKQNDN